MNMMKFCVLFVCAACFSSGKDFDGGISPAITVRWQRLVNEEGHTCERCAATEANVRTACELLRKSLAPLGIAVMLEERALDPAVCAGDISESNRIWISDRSLEEWLGADVGMSPCGFCCGELGDETECRTIVIKGAVYEAIPVGLLIRAGLLAASQMVGAEPEPPCCGTIDPDNDPSGKCCPEPAIPPDETK